MTRQLFTYLFAIVISFSMISCEKVNSNDLANDTPVYQSYKLVYDNYYNETTATAEFKVRNSSGVHIKLVEDAYIRFNGKRHHDYWPVFHEYTWKRKGFTDVDFLYNKNWDQDFLNTIYADDIAFTVIPHDLDEIDINSAAKIYWDGAPLENNESITLSIEQSDRTVVASTHRRGDKYIYFDVDDFSRLYQGNATLHIEREKKYRLNDEDEYAGGKKVIVLKDRKNIYLY